MPFVNAEAIKQFILGTLAPIGVSALTTWLFATVHVFNLFGINEGQVAGEITQAVTFVVTVGIGWLTAHHVLRGHYTPSAKAAAARGR